MNDVYQIDLEPLKKDRFFCADIGYKWIFTNFPLLFSFLSFCPTQGHAIEAFCIHLNIYPTTWIKERFNKGPHSKCILIPLHALFSTTWTSFFSSSILSPYKIFINKDILLAIM
jgi:hypothetical protein